MIHWAMLALAAVAALVTFAWVTVGRSGRPRLVAGLTALLSACAFAAAVEVIGQPKPVELEWRPTAGIEIVGIIPAPDGTAVYVWAMRSGVPVAYALPWPSDTEKLSQLMDRFRRRERTGERFFTADSNDRVADVAPPPPMPPKN